MPQLLRFKTCSILFFGQVRPLGDFRILRLTFFGIAWNENTEINRVRYSNGSMANWSVRRVSCLSYIADCEKEAPSQQ